MTLTIDGTDIVPYIAFSGLKWQRSDIDAPDAERTMDGVMHRGRVATKIRWDVTCRILKSDELAIVLSAIMPEYVEVTYTDPVTNTDVTKTMYSNNHPASFLMIKNGVEYWNGVTFPLIEQ